MATAAVAVRGGAVAGVREGLISLRRRGERGGYEDKDDGVRLDAGLLRDASGEASVLRHEQRRMGGGEGHWTRGSEGAVLRRGSQQGRAESGAAGSREAGEHSLSCGGSMEEVGGWMDLDRGG